MIWIAYVFVRCVVLSILLIIYFTILKYARKLWLYLDKRQRLRSIAFFHPYCNSGGGGERVLWTIIHGILSSEKKEHKMSRIVIYSGDLGISINRIFDNVENHFQIKLTDEQCNKIDFVFIRTRPLLEAKWYPIATMIGQSVGSMIVGLECILRFPPDIFFDTTGAAFIYPLVHLMIGSHVMAYVHYPTISTDMLKAVVEKRPSYNNNNRITSNKSMSLLKQLYYRMFTWAYGFVGSYATTVMVNSTWTQRHIRSLWNFSSERGKRRINDRTLHKIYPPCNTTYLENIPITSRNKERLIISVGQFRPEKDHMLQLRFANVKLVMLGSTRNIDDEILVSKLRREVMDLGLDGKVEIIVNVPFSQLETWLARATIGLHTMWNEHFGISIVEMMAAGLIVIAHNSGGPMMDIVVPYESGRTGYLAATPEEYARAMYNIFSLSEAEEIEIRNAARLSSRKFSEEVFKQSVLKII